MKHLIGLLSFCFSLVGCATTMAQPSTLYFSDCQAGAAEGCVAGSNSRDGRTPATAKQSIAGLNINSLPAGTKLLFARGGAWAGFSAFLDNRNATVAAPLVFDAYGNEASAKPVLRGAFIMGGTYNNDFADGGYTVRNVKVDGGGTVSDCFHIHSQTKGVLIENSEITGCQLGIHSQNMGANGNVGLTIRGNNIHHNRGMGFLGDAFGLVIEGNTFESNNASGSALDHAIYISGKGTNGVVRNNQLINNSTVSGVCRGGNLTIHGQWDGLLIEGNTIRQVRSGPGCYGISITDGYESAEWFRNTVVRNNTIVNLGDCAVCVRGAPGILIEGNIIKSNQPEHQAAILITKPNGADDDPGDGPVLRNNVVCFERAPRSSFATRLSVQRGSETGTAYRTGADATTGACAN